MSHIWTRWFRFFCFLQISSKCVGLKRQDAGSDTAVGPRHNRFTVLHGSQRSAVHRRAQTYTVDTKYRIEDHSHGDRKHRHFTGDINVRCNVHKYDSIIPLDSQYSPVRCGPAPQSTAGCLQHRNGSISAATTWN